MHCFGIDLDRFPERWAFVKAEFEKIGLAAARFPAVDALRLGDYDGVK